MSGPFLTSQPSRRVGRFRVRVAVEEDARRAAILLSDALHTASLASFGFGKVLVVRRLALGRIEVRGSSAALALQVERRLHEAASTAVPFDSPAAPNANAVIFPGRTEAIVALAQRHARGVGAIEWFWPSAVAQWRAGLSRGETWLALIEAAHGLPEAVLVVATLIAVAVRAGGENELFAAVPPGYGAAWLQLEGWRATAPPPETVPAVSALAAHHGEIVRRWQRRWGSADDRLVWLATMLAIIEQPARAADPSLPARATSWLEAAAERPGNAQGTIEAQTVGEAQTSLEKQAVREPGEAFSPPPRSSAGEDTASREENRPPASAASLRGQMGDEIPPLPSPQSSGSCATLKPEIAVAPAGDFTAFAGLLFLVPVLEKLGFADFLATHPVLLESGFSVELLHFVAVRLGMAPSDPLALALGEGDPSTPVPTEWKLPSPARQILAWPLPRASLDSPLVAWATAMRRWCRRRARVGLASLVCRPGYVAASRTQLDVSFDLAGTDLRVRRCALDVDPGWVPWLGRVVRFHYLEADELRA
ncbi:MAG: hypothetical protein WCF18_11355 [Chthoniobacteraceae bacterium]